MNNKKNHSELIYEKLLDAQESLDVNSDTSVYKLVEEIKSSILEDPEREKAFIQEITAEDVYFPEEMDESFKEFSKRFKTEKHADTDANITASLMIRIPMLRKLALEGLSKEQQRKVDVYAASLALRYVEAMLLENARSHIYNSQEGGKQSSKDAVREILERFYLEKFYFKGNKKPAPSDLTNSFADWYKEDPEANAIIEKIDVINYRQHLFLRKRIGKKKTIRLDDRWYQIIKRFNS